MTSPVKLGLLACLAALACGCGYHIGSLAGPNYRTVAVPVFRNKTVVPQIQALVTDSIIKQFQADGSLRIVGEAEADLLIEGVIFDVRREPLRFAQTNLSVTREYRLTLFVSFTLRDRRTGKAILENKQASGQTDYFVVSDMQASEAQALPLAAENLAHKVVEQVAEKW
jgi:hypothetical protein